MASVVISGDTSGAITLQAPAVSGNTTLNLPTVSGGTLVTSDSSGNVGIGTTTPNGKVDSSWATGFNYAATRTSSSGYNGLAFYENTTNTSYLVEFGSGAGGGQRLQMWTNTAFPIAFGTNNTERMRINSSGIVTMPFQPAFLATGSSSNTTYTASSVIVFGTLNSTFVSSNRSSGYNTSTSTYTAPVAGLYQFYAQFYTSSNPTSIAWWKNGSQMSWNDAALVGFNTTGVNNLVNGSAIIELAAGDTINVRVRTGNANVIIYGGHSAFWGYLIG